jgi:hypothetical protein
MINLTRLSTELSTANGVTTGERTKDEKLELDQAVQKGGI